MRIHWTTDYGQAIGNSLGYGTHNDRMREALVRAGATMDESAPIAFHVMPAHRFEPVPGKFNVLSTAWEANQLPELWRTTLKDCDLILPTARFMVEPLRQMFPNKRIEVLSLGVDGSIFLYVDRRRPENAPRNRPFRFLWLGAPNARKGAYHVLEAWKAFQNDERFELYIKTTDAEKKMVVKNGNIVYDTRKLPVAELAELYQSAHCFLWPSVGEGWGLPLGESLATGCPAIYTPVTAMLDIAPPARKLGYPIKHGWSEVDWSWKDADAKGTSMEVRVNIANPDTNDLAERMAYVVRNYNEALKRGRDAARWIRERFTWDKCGAKLHRILEQVMEDRNVQAEAA